MGLEHIRHVPFDSAAAAAAATILLELEKQDKPIGPLDMLIAGTVVSRGAALATSNAGEFSRVSRVAGGGLDRTNPSPGIAASR